MDKVLGLPGLPVPFALLNVALTTENMVKDVETWS